MKMNVAWSERKVATKEVVECCDEVESIETSLYWSIPIMWDMHSLDTKMSNTHA